MIARKPDSRFLLVYVGLLLCLLGTVAAVAVMAKGAKVKPPVVMKDKLPEKPLVTRPRGTSEPARRKKQEKKEEERKREVAKQLETLAREKAELLEKLKTEAAARKEAEAQRREQERQLAEKQKATDAELAVFKEKLRKAEEARQRSETKQREALERLHEDLEAREAAKKASEKAALSKMAAMKATHAKQLSKLRAEQKKLKSELERFDKNRVRELAKLTRKARESSSGAETSALLKTLKSKPTVRIKVRAKRRLSTADLKAIRKDLGLRWLGYRVEVQSGKSVVTRLCLVEDHQPGPIMTDLARIREELKRVGQGLFHLEDDRLFRAREKRLANDAGDQELRFGLCNPRLAGLYALHEKLAILEALSRDLIKSKSEVAAVCNLLKHNGSVWVLTLEGIITTSGERVTVRP